MAHLFVADHGDEAGPLVVVVHGSLDRSSAFLKVLRRLPQVHGVRYDRRGYAHSIEVPPEPTVEVQVADLAGIVADRPVVLFGHSVGGVIALAFAARHPQLVRAVAVYEASMAWVDWWPSRSAGAAALADADRDPAAAAETFLRRMIGDERWAALPERTRAQRRSEGPALVADLRSIRTPATVPYVPAELRVPVIAAYGSVGAPHYQQAAKVLAEEAPQGELHVVEGAAHGAHLTHPEATAELILLALRRAEQAGR